MNRYCIDTVTYSRFRRGESRILRFWTAPSGSACQSSFLGNSVRGLSAESKKPKNITELDQFLSAPVVEVLPVDRRTAEIFSAMVAELRTKGRPLPINDVWIAAAAIRAGATLITWDAHFRDIPLLGAMILDS
jgi:tRNA(fMet)-specific endonuclease VapC